MPTLPFELYVFDWSGTISDDRQPVYRSNQLLLEHFNKQPVSYDVFYANIRASVFDFYEEQGITGNPEELYALYRRYLNQAIASGIKPVLYSDAHEVLNYLQSNGAVMGVVSSHPQENLEQEMQENNVRHFFDFVIGNCKEKTAALSTVASQASHPTAAVYTGDMTYDIRAARVAGMRAAAVATGYHPYEVLEREQPDFLLRALHDIKNVSLI